MLHSEIEERAQFFPPPKGSGSPWCFTMNQTITSEQIFAYLQEHGPASSAAIGFHFNYSGREIGAFMRGLKAEGKVVMDREIMVPHQVIWKVA